MMIEEQRVNEEFLEADILKGIEKLAKPQELPEYEHLHMSDAFTSEEEDDEDIDWEDICGVDEEDDRERPFEDCPMPILECGVRTASEVMESKMLIDSGSALNLVSGVMARKLQKKGCIVKATKKQVRIKVANGKRSVLNTTMSLQLQLGPEISEGTDFHVLEDLPFYLILGHEACMR